MLLLDEPTAGMGPEERWQMIETGPPVVEAQAADPDFHRARHGHRVQVRADHPRAELRQRAGGRQARGRAPQSEGHRGLSRRPFRSGQDSRARPSFSRRRAIDVFYGSSQILFGVSLAVTRRADHGAARAQRRGQIHDPEGDRRHCADRRAGTIRVLGKEMQGRKPHTSPAPVSASCRRIGRCSRSTRWKTIS